MNKLLTGAGVGYRCSTLCYSGTSHKKWNYCRLTLQSPMCLINRMKETSLQFVDLGKKFVVSPEEIVTYVVNVNIVWPLNILGHFNLVCLCTNFFFFSKLFVV
jgi:hypothetical protein